MHCELDLICHVVTGATSHLLCAGTPLVPVQSSSLIPKLLCCIVDEVLRCIGVTYCVVLVWSVVFIVVKCCVVFLWSFVLYCEVLCCSVAKWCVVLLLIAVFLWSVLFNVVNCCVVLFWSVVLFIFWSVVL